jgi:hypothetical protein
MRQTWTAVLLVILAAVPALASNITVTAPAAGESLEIGALKPVTWTFAGLPGTTKVMLVLFGTGGKLGIIAQDLAIGSNGKGSYDWNAGACAGNTAAAGSGYSIKVRTMDNSVSGLSGSFSLSAKPGNTGGGTPGIGDPLKNLLKNARPCMAVTSPKAGDAVDPYNVVYVKWVRSSGLDANVSLQLLRSGKGRMFPIVLAANIPNNGGFNWDPTAMAPDPGIYTIKVRTLDGKCEALSGEFTMKELGGIEILSPKGGEVWESGSSHPVTWKRMGNVQTLEILLGREGSWNHTLAQGVDAKLGTRTCIFVRGDTDGANPICYRIFINHSGGNTVNPSGCFTLTGNPDLAITDVVYSGLFNVGYDQTFTVKVENKGAVASQPCQGAMKVNGVTAKTFPVPAIQPGQSASIPVTWKVACPGKITITIDTGGANVEADKSNNVWEKNFC